MGLILFNNLGTMKDSIKIQKASGDRMVFAGSFERKEL